MLKNYFYNGLSIILTTIAGIVASVVLARVLGPEKWGEYSQAGWLMAITATLFGGGLIFTAMRFLGTYSLVDGSAERPRIIVWLTLAQLLLILPGCLLLWFFASQINDALGWHLEPRLIQVSALGILAISLTQLGTAMLRGLQRFHALALISIPAAIVILSTIPIVLRYPNVGVLVVATAVGQLLLIPLFIILIRERRSARPHLAVTGPPAIWRIMTRYSFLVYLNSLADQVVWQRSEIFFLGRLSDPAQSAYYALAYTLAGTVFAVTAMAITGTLTPMFSSSTDASGRQHKDLPQLYRQSFSFLNWIALPCAVGLAIVSPTVIRILYGEAYTPVIPVINLVIVSSMIGVYARPSASVIHAINRPSVLFIATLLVLPINLGLAWYLVPRQGAVGAAVANLAAQSVGAAVAVIYATWVVGLHYDWNSIGKSAIGALACGTTAWLAIRFISVPVPSLFVAIVAGSAVYFAMGIALKDETTHQIKGAAQSRFSTMRTRFVHEIAGLRY